MNCWKFGKDTGVKFHEGHGLYMDYADKPQVSGLTYLFGLHNYLPGVEITHSSFATCYILGSVRHWNNGAS